MCYLHIHVLLQKKTPVARAVAVLPVPKPPMEVQLQEGVMNPRVPIPPRLTVRQRHGKLFDELDLSGLDSWPTELADAASWPNTMVCFCWIQWNWAVPTLQNT